MKKEEVPQDPSALDKFTKEVCYALDEKGEYTTTLSRGWQVKADALGITWQDVEARVNEARLKIKNGELSPIAYFMEVHMMDISILSAYTGFWQWTIKRHLRPQVFKKLSDKKLEKYAEAFQIKLEELKNF
ncbi:MAG: hypothetical protein KA841_06705 [Chitinophagales bacterium]|jgi:hypothetical protein|nr:hypothetical protein [Chitinophagales bacterium]